MKIKFDGNKANTKKHRLFRGNGMVSANNSSRLLLDYKTEHPQQYQKILELLFGEKGCRINYLKIEMGSDINSSSGTEPCVKRFPDEKTNVSRGAGFVLAVDAKKINPDLTLDMLWWGEPWWVSSATDVYAARYDWYKSNLISAYETYGLVFDYVSATQNERAYDVDWIVYLSEHLKSEKNAPYDFSKIKIVAGEEVCTWNFAQEVSDKKYLAKHFNAIGSHYTSWSTEAAQKISDEFGMELFFREGSSPMRFAEGTYRFDGNGLCGLNGMLDIATRFITMYAGGKMTMCEYQPAVASYYDGACYCHKQFILANQPWNGSFTFDPGFFMAVHFGMFIKKGWAFIEGANFGDGKPGGDGHCIVDSKINVMSAMDLQTGDYTIVLANNTKNFIPYDFDFENVDLKKNIFVWETRGPDAGQKFNENYLKKIDCLKPNDGKIHFDLKPYSLVTFSTLDFTDFDFTDFDFDFTDSNKTSVMSLPYFDDFSYKNFSEDYLSKRGNAPRYTCDQGGAFEVIDFENKKVLQQLIEKDKRAKEWGWTPEPVTTLGDDRWSDYSASVKIRFEKNEPQIFAGIAIRYIMGCDGESGFNLRLFANGKWIFKMARKILLSGNLTDFDSSKWHTIFLSAVDNKIIGKIDNHIVFVYTAKSDFPSSGRIALLSSYHKNLFSDLEILPQKNIYYIERFDQTNPMADYFGNWNHNLMSSFKNYKRTISTGFEGAKLKIKFSGTKISLCGENQLQKKTFVRVIVDGKIIYKKMEIKNSLYRNCFLQLKNLSEKNHVLGIKVLEGKISLDSFEVSSTC